MCLHLSNFDIRKNGINFMKNKDKQPVNVEEYRRYLLHFRLKLLSNTGTWSRISAELQRKYRSNKMF